MRASRFLPARRSVALAVLFGLLAGLLPVPTLVTAQTFDGAPPEPGGRLGTAVAIDPDGGRMAVSEPGHLGGRGRVLVYERATVGDDWTLFQTIVQPTGTPAPIDFAFGSALALGGDRLAIGVSDGLDPTEPGRVWVHTLGFEPSSPTLSFDDGFWIDSPSVTADLFGTTLAFVERDRLLVGAPLATVGGAVHEIDLSGGTEGNPLDPEEISTLDTSGLGLTDGDRFGWSLAVDEDPDFSGYLLAVGAPGTDDDPGAVHLFFDDFSDTFRRIGAPLTAPGDRTGSSVDVVGHQVAYVSTTDVALEARVRTVRYDPFGGDPPEITDRGTVTVSNSVFALEDPNYLPVNRIVALGDGALSLGDPVNGGVEVFRRSTAGVYDMADAIGLAPAGPLVPSSARMGSSVAMLGTTVIAGAPATAPGGATDAGAVHSLRIPFSAENDLVFTLPGTTVLIDVRANDTFGDDLQLVNENPVVSGPGPASAFCSFTTCQFEAFGFGPPPDNELVTTTPGTYTFDYTLTDGVTTDTATVTVEIRDRVGAFGTPSFTFDDPDPVFDPADWPETGRVDFRLLSGDGLEPLRAYVMNDADFAYVAFDTSSLGFEPIFAGIEVDDPLTDAIDRWSVIETSTFDEYLVPDELWEFDGLIGGTNDVEAAFTPTAIILRRALDTGDTRDVPLVPGDGVTFRLGANESGIDFDDATKAPDSATTIAVWDILEPPAAVAFTVTTTANDGEGSLRQAILDANAVPVTTIDPDPITISFDIPGDGPHTISPTPQLPAITRPVVIDGYTQPGASPNTNPITAGSNASIRIQIDGGIGAGLFFNPDASGSTVRGLSITGWTQGLSLGVAAIRVEGNFIGLDPTGTTAAANTNSGITTSDNDHVIGGVTPAARNVISGNGGNGISLTGGAPGATGVSIIGNIIGLDASGTTAVPNSIGVNVSSPSNVIGGDTPAARNLIAGNSSRGVFMSGSGATGNVLSGNWFGTDVTGSVAIPNGFGTLGTGAVSITNNATDNLIGGTSPGSGNRIRSSFADGVAVFGVGTLGNSVLGNSIAGSTGLGIRLQSIDVPTPVITNVESGSSLLIEGLLTDSPGDYRIEVFANSVCNSSGAGEGEFLLGSIELDADDFSAGTAAFSLDVSEPDQIDNITATATGPDGTTSEFSACVDPVAPSDPFTVTNTDDTGTGSLRQAITDANAVPTTFEPDPITISFDIPGDGPHTITPATLLPAITRPVVIDGYTQPGASPNTNPISQASDAVIQIEINGSGSTGLNLLGGSRGSTVRGLSMTGWQNGIFVGGAGAGIGSRIEGNHLGLAPDGTTERPNTNGVQVSGSGHVIGGNADDARNVISGNDNAGVIVNPGGTGTRVGGNVIGLDASGAAARPNASGVTVGGTGNLVGGPAVRNVIAGNTDHGVRLIGTATSNVVQGNLIGTDTSGVVPVPNGTDGAGHAGVQIQQQATDNLIGGTAPGEGNRILNSRGDGVLVSGESAFGNSILGNSISGSAGLGIRLDTIVAPTPMILEVESGSTLQIEGVLVAAPGDYRIEVFANSVCNSSGAGEGEFLLGSIELGSDDFFEVSAGFSLDVSEPDEIDNITATATGPDGTTSEFSTCFEPAEPAEPGSIIDVDASVIDTSATTGYAVRLADIPTEQLLAGAEAVAGAPLRAADLQASPLGAIPLRSIPLRAIAASIEDRVVLSDVPIEGGWEPLLRDTPLAGLPLQTVTLAEALAVIGELPADLDLADLDVSVSDLGSLDTIAVLWEGAPESGIAAVPLRSIPLRSIPLGAIPLRSIPLRSIPLGAIDLDATPLGAIPLRAIGDLAATPLGAIGIEGAPLGAIPLGAIPLGAIPLGAIPLRSIPLGAIPLRSITIEGFDDPCEAHDDEFPAGQSCTDLGISLDTTVLDYVRIVGGGDIAATPLRSIPLGAIPLGAIPLGAIDIAGTPLGAIPLGAIPLRSIPLGAIPLRSIPLRSIDGSEIAVSEVCESLGLGDTCTLPDIDLADYLTATGESSLESTPLRSIDIAALPLRSIPLRSIPLRSIEIAGVPLGAIPLRAIDLEASPLGAIPLGAIDLQAADLADVPLRSIPLAAIDSLTVEDLFGYLETSNDEIALSAVLGDVLDHLTLAFFALLGDDFGGLTLGELLVAILLASDFPWEDLPLEDLDLRGVACGTTTTGTCTGGIAGSEPDTLGITVTFDVVDGISTGSNLRVAVPEDWVPAPDGAVLLDNDLGTTITVYERLRRDVGGWVADLPPLPPGSYRFDLALLPPTRPATALVSSVSIVERGTTLPGGIGAPVPIAAVAPSGPAGTAGSPKGIIDDALYVGYLTTPGQQDWYEIPAPGPGFRVAVYLSNFDGDVDTFVYRPDTAPPLSGAGTERSIPLASVPVEDGGVEPDGSTDLSPQPLADAPVQENLTLVAASTNSASDTEQAVFFSRAGADEEYRIQVAGYRGATSTSPYVLRVRYEPVVRTSDESQCPARTEVSAIGTTAAPTIGDSTSTLILTNPQRMNQRYGGLPARLTDLAGSGLVDGVVVDIAGIPGVAATFNAWDASPCNPDLANQVAGLIQAWIQSTVAQRPSIRHVVIVGGDEIVPLARLQDSTVIANESTYVDDFLTSSALHGAHSARTYLSDSPYGDLSPIPWLDRYAYLPELGVGRLIETPTQIDAAIATFLDNDGLLSPETMAVAGYDFLTDGAEEVKANLLNIVDPDGAGPVLQDVDANATLLQPDWDRPLLRAIGFGGGAAPDIVSPNAHYDHWRLLPALGDLTKDESDLFTIDDLDGVDLLNRIVFTMGCHGGLNVPAGAATDASTDSDWPEVYSAARAIYIGNTGYGYGDTATVALTEQLMANFAFYLDGDRTVGQALAQAKQDQFGKAGLYGVYDLKSIEQVTLYGLPMWQIDGPGREPGASPISAPSTEPVTGLQAASFSITPEFDEVESDAGTHYAVDGDTQFLHWNPIQPKTSIDVTQDGLVATGVLLTDLESIDLTATDAAFGRPIATSASERQPTVRNTETVFPSTFATLGTSNAVNTSPSGPPANLQQYANIIPGQYIGDNQPVQRLFGRMDGLAHYVPADAAGGVDWTPPRIRRTSGDAGSRIAVFEVDAVDLQSDVVRVVVTYRAAVASDGTSRWRSIDLARSTAGGALWTGAGAYADTVLPPLDYLVQAVNRDGVVGVATAKGELFGATPLDTAPAVDPEQALALAVTCNDAPCSLQAYDGPVTITATDATITVDDGPPTPGSTVVVDPGFHVVTVTRGGTSTSFWIQILGLGGEEPVDPDDLLASVTCNGEPCDPDASYEPPVVLAVPEDVTITLAGGEPAPGPVTLDEPGTYVVTLTLRGVSAEFTIQIVDPVPDTITFDGFFSPLKADVDPLQPEIINLVRAGRAVPLKWRLYRPDGTEITSTEGIRVLLRFVPCAALNPSESNEADSAPSVGGGLRYTGGKFQLNLKTMRSWRGQCAELFVTVDDVTVGKALFQFR